MVFVVKDIIVIFIKTKTVLILNSFKRYFSHSEKSSSLTLWRHFNFGHRSPGFIISSMYMETS